MIASSLRTSSKAMGENSVLALQAALSEEVPPSPPQCDLRVEIRSEEVPTRKQID
jgi:hypothetical protein